MKKKNKNRKGKKMSTEKRIIVNDQTGKAKPAPHAPVPQAEVNKAKPGRILPNEIRLGSDQQKDYVLDPVKDLPELSGAGPQDPIDKAIDAAVNFKAAAQNEVNKLAEDLNKIHNMSIASIPVQTNPVEATLADKIPEDVMRMFADMTPEQKLDLAKALGLPVEAKSKKEKGTANEFNKAANKLCNYLWDPLAPGIDLQDLIENCNFPGPFALTFGVDHDGFFFANIKRLRKEYTQRKEKDQPVDSNTPAQA